MLPTTHTDELRSTVLGSTIPAGHATGLDACVTTETNQGPVVVAHCIGKVYAPGETDSIRWRIEGEPNTSLTIDETPTVEYTCATIVNRLPILVEAEPGYVATDRQAMAEFRTYPLHAYMQRQ